jgi:hydroxymethylbilane synthase
MPKNHIVLDWMIPAPAQGAMLVVAMENDEFSKNAVSELNHKETEICTGIERDFLRELEGGCSAPIGALAKIENKKIIFKGILFSLDGKHKVEVEKVISEDSSYNAGKVFAQEVLNMGGKELMSQIKAELK